MDFELFKEEKAFYSRFHISEDTRHFIYTDKVEFHVIELPKLPKKIQENSSDILLWAKFFAAEEKEDFEMLAKMNRGINSAYQRLQVISQDDVMRMEYEARMKAVRDQNQFVVQGREEGQKEMIESMLQSVSIEEVERLTKKPVFYIKRIMESWFLEA